MNRAPEDLFDDLRGAIRTFGVTVLLREMDVETPGSFDGPTITINPLHDRQSASFYLVHSFGSIVQWSTDYARARKVFDGLRDATKERDPDPRGFEEALHRYRLFEQTSSDHAVWMLAEIGHSASISPYTIFFRADIEAMTIFHRTGKAPRWPDFYADWKRQVAAGTIDVKPFTPRACPRFRPRAIEQQQVLQERD